MNNQLSGVSRVTEGSSQLNIWPTAQMSPRVHLEEFESAESAERTMSGHDENVEALSCDCGERQNMSHFMTCGDAPTCTWTHLAIPTPAGVNCAKYWEESI